MREWMIYVLFVLVLLGEIVILQPFGNYPLHDSWVPALTIQSFIETGQIFYPAIIVAFSFTQIVLGILVSELFGFSFVLLRFTSVLFALGAVWFLYAFLRNNRFSRAVSGCVCALVMAFPLFINLSYQFMSDIPALFFLCGAITFFSRGFREQRLDMMAGGMAFGILGFFTRQTDALLLVAASILLFLYPIGGRARSLALIGITVLATSGIGATLWKLNLIPGIISAFYLPADPAARTFQSLLYLLYFLFLSALFLAPVILSTKIDDLQAWLMKRSFFRVLPYGLLFAVGGSIAVWSFSFYPFFTTMSAFGLGAPQAVMRGELSYWGSEVLYGILFSALIPALMWIVTNGCSIVATAIRAQPHNTFLWLYGGMYVAGIVLLFPYVDRYYLLLLPLAAYIAATIFSSTHWSRTVFIGMISMMAIYGIVGTYNFFAWNDARWTLGARLIASGILPEDINGGFEWNGLTLYKDHIDEPLRAFDPRQNLSLPITSALIVREEAPYALSFSALHGYRIIDDEPVHGLFSNISTIYALEKNN